MAPWVSPFAPPSAPTHAPAESVWRQAIEARGVPAKGAWRDTTAGPYAHLPVGRGGLLSFATMRRMYHNNAVIRMTVDTLVRQLYALDHEILAAADQILAPWKLAYARDLFATPNPTDTEYETWCEMLLRDYFVCDQLACEIAKTPEGWPAQLLPLDAATVVPVYDDKRTLLRYEQRPPGTPWAVQDPITFQPNEMLYIQGNPCTYRTMSVAPLESLMLEVAGDLYAMKRNVDFFTDGFHQDVIAFLEDVSQDEAERITATLEEKYKGQPYGIPLVGAKGRVEQLRATNRDMEFTEFEHWLLQRACGVYQIDVSQVLMLQPLQTKATGDQQQQVHQSKSLWPNLAKIRRAFTNQVLKQIDPHLRFVFSEENKIDSSTEATVAQTKLASGTVTINEVRAEQGLDPWDWPTTTGPDGEEISVFDLPFVTAAEVFGATPSDPIGINPLTGEPFAAPGTNPFTGQPFGGAGVQRARSGGRFRAPHARPALARDAAARAHHHDAAPAGVAPAAREGAGDDG